MAYQKLQAASAAAVTPSDTTNIPAPSLGENSGCTLYVGFGGNVRVLTAGGETLTLYNVVTGTFVPVNVLRVYETGTTAQNIVALW